MSEILLLTPDFPPRQGGVAKYLHTLATGLRDRIFVIAESDASARFFDQLAEYPIRREALFFRFFWPKWMKSVWIMMRESPRIRTVIVSHVLPFGTAANFAGWFTRKPYVVILHGMDLGLGSRTLWKRFLTRIALRGARGVVTNSESLASEVRERFGVSRVRVSYPCIPQKMMPKTLLAHPPDGGCRFLTVSRLVERKGHMRVLEALAMLRERGQLCNIRYRIIGEGPMNNAIRKRVEELRLSDIVRIETGVSDADRERAYASSDVFIMPTVRKPEDREGFGLAYIEAAAFGVPSIATRHPGVDEAVLDEKTGILVPDNDIPALAYAMNRLASNYELRKTLAKAAFERIKTQFSCALQHEAIKEFL